MPGSIMLFLRTCANTMSGTNWLLHAETHLQGDITEEKDTTEHSLTILPLKVCLRHVFNYSFTPVNCAIASFANPRCELCLSFWNFVNSKNTRRLHDDAEEDFVVQSKSPNVNIRFRKLLYYRRKLAYWSKIGPKLTFYAGIKCESR